MSRVKPFTLAELEAIQEALIFRSAGELGEEAQPAQDYNSALDKICERIAVVERKASR